MEENERRLMLQMFSGLVNLAGDVTQHYSTDDYYLSSALTLRKTVFPGSNTIWIMIITGKEIAVYGSLMSTKYFPGSDLSDALEYFKEKAIEQGFLND